MGKHFSGAETKERYRLTVTSNYFHAVVQQKNQGVKQHALTTFFMSISCIMPKIMRSLENTSDEKGNLWPVLSREIAYEKTAKYAKIKNIVKEGAYHGMLGVAAGSLIGSAIGIVSGDSVATAAGKGAAVGAAAGATHVIRLDL